MRRYSYQLTRRRRLTTTLKPAFAHRVVWISATVWLLRELTLQQFLLTAATLWHLWDVIFCSALNSDSADTLSTSHFAWSHLQWFYNAITLPSRYFDDFAYAERSFQSFSSSFETQLFPVIFLCLSIFTLSTNIIDRHFCRARIDFLTQLFLQVFQPDMRTEFGLGNERPSFRRAGSSHEDPSLSILDSPSAVIFTAILQFYFISIFAIYSKVETSLVWAIKGRPLDALAHSTTSSRCSSSFAFELI